MDAKIILEIKDILIILTYHPSDDLNYYKRNMCLYSETTHRTPPYRLIILGIVCFLTCKRNTTSPTSTFAKNVNSEYNHKETIWQIQNPFYKWLVFV